MSVPIPPHGGVSELTTCAVSSAEAQSLATAHASAPKIVVTGADLSTVRRFGDGALTPLTGPMTKAVFDRVLDDMVIENNGKLYAWSIPLSLPVTEAEKATLKVGAPALLVDESGSPVGVLQVEDVFDWNKKRYNSKVYGTERDDHPGAKIANDDPRGTLVGGTIKVFPVTRNENDIVQKYSFSPAETRAKLAGWQIQGKPIEAAVAFQTRNPLHRAHEYAMVYAVEKLTSDGLRAAAVLNPLVGETKSDDVPASIRMETYANLKNKKLIGQGDSDPEVWQKAGYSISEAFDLYALDIKMFYGGPREAVMHGIYRQNYGFSHIVIGRKHADAPFADGTNIWGDFDAQEIFNNLKGDLKIKPVNVGFAAYYEELGRVGLIEVHKEKGWKPVSVAGRILREQLEAGQVPDPRIIRQETSELLIAAYARKKAAANGTAPKSTHITWHDSSVTRDMRQSLNDHKGATLWFTGLSGSGKSTLANAVAVYLHEHGVRTFVLDGDNIRQGLNKDLGFSPEDRKENIRRIGEVAKLFTDNGTIVGTAFISPYKEDREIASSLQPGDDFLEIYVAADLDICEQRDPKGLYKKARAGVIKGFTGIDAPYEAPDSPALTVDTGKSTLEECVQQVVQALIDRNIVPATVLAGEPVGAN
ncbi:MAG: adenylyl-sulfate kinase [Sumerlaeia bacterium]